MTITALNQVRYGTTTVVEATSSLTAPVYFHWYLDGSWVGSNTTGKWTFVLASGDQARLDVQDTNSASYDPVANAPAGWPARRTLFWVRSTDTDVAGYTIEQQVDGGAWTEVGYKRQGNEWSHTWLTGRLTDLSTYAWRITPVDAAKNAGTALTFSSEKVVRTPDAPNFTVTLDEGTTRVTWAAA